MQLNAESYKPNEDGAIHAMGNGKFLVYGRGADIQNVFGPPYSTSSLFAAQWEYPDGVGPRFLSFREKGTNIWGHRMTRDGKTGGTSREFVCPGLPAYLCCVELEEDMQLRVRLPQDFDVIPGAISENLEELQNRDQVLVVCPDTARIFIYPVVQKSYLSITAWGDGWKAFETQDGELVLRFGPGKAWFTLTGGSSYPEVVLNTAHVLRQGYEPLLAEAAAADAEIAARIKRPLNKAGVSSDLVERVQELCESTAFVIKAQQAEDGGIMAGHNYPLAYLRDQYGTCRGLLALGLLPEARKNLEFRYHKWKLFGTLHNAESMGHDRARHVHENDDIEGTAYTMIQAFDYAEASGEWEFIEEMFPMLDWCWRAQLPHLKGGMLPFNGDETYVAGGFLPRYALNDGSMEATLLFLEAGRKLLPLARSKGWWKADEAGRFNQVLEETERLFLRNFLRGDRFIANNPCRAELAEMPLFRHGVCEKCNQIGWTQRNHHGRYVCPSCLQGEPLEAAADEEMEVHSANLLPLFIHSTVLTDRQKALCITTAAEIFERNGYLPTIEGQKRYVGYDAGLLLYALTELKHPIAARVLEHVLKINDSTGAWVEYYEAGIPQGTRCRPWESGINIAAVIYYLDNQR